MVMCHFLFDSAEDFVAAFTPHAAVLQDDSQNTPISGQAIQPLNQGLPHNSQYALFAIHVER
ncbi:hypothetical protein U2W12_01115 [Methylomicrobium sp. Wu6]|nr:hypothetical protein [Methylomicrobium sp. Wu6]